MLSRFQKTLVDSISSGSIFLYQKYQLLAHALKQHIQGNNVVEIDENNLPVDHAVFYFMTIAGLFTSAPNLWLWATRFITTPAYTPPPPLFAIDFPFDPSQLEQKREEKVNARPFDHQRFDDLGFIPPEELQCSIMATLMVTPVYHPATSMKKFIYDKSTIADLKTNGVVKHPHTTTIVLASQFITDERLKAKIPIYLSIVKEYYSWLAQISSPLRDNFTMQVIPYMIDKRAYSTDLLYAEQSLVSRYNENQNRFKLFAPLIVLARSSNTNDNTKKSIQNFLN
ncbi:MAG: U-box domain-containing protein [Gammaproteobacteria bacterium]